MTISMRMNSFYADLEGLEAIDGEGKSYGTVTGVFDFGAGDLLELKGPGKRPVLIPFTEWSVLEIDLEAGTMLVDPLAAGLIDDPNDKPESPFTAQGPKPPKGK